LTPTPRLGAASRSGAHQFVRRWRKHVTASAPTWLLWGIVGSLFAILWGLILFFSALQRERLLDESRHELEQLRHAVASHTDGMLRSAEIDLRVIDDWLQANPNIDPLRDPAFNAVVQRMRDASGGLIDPRMVSTQGKLHYLPEKPGFAPVDVADRGYFKDAASDAGGRIHIAGPVLSRVTGKWGIPISLRLTRPVGDMQVVFIGIELDRLMALHEQFRIRPSGSVALVRTDGKVLSRTPYLEGFVGKDLSNAPTFKAFVERPNGTIVVNGALTDGVSRLLSYEHLATYPVIVAVTRGVEDTLQTYYARRRLLLWVVGAVTVVGLFFTWRLGASQHALREAQAAQRVLTSVFETTSDLVAQIAPSGRLMYMNPAARRLLGLAPGEPLQDRAVMDLTAPWMTQERAAEILSAAQATGSWIGEATLTDAQGHEVPVSHMVIAHRGRHGEIQHYSSVMRDITQQKQAEESFRLSERRLRSITDHLPMRVSYIDRDQRYRFLNLAYDAAFGKPRTELYGLTVREVLGEGAYGQVAPHLARALAGETVSFDSEITTLQGYRCYRATYVPQFADDGKTVLGVVALILDSTAQKLEERRLIELSQLDSLTGLLNRAGFEQRRHDAMEHSLGTKRLMALMLLDIDEFKQVNDTLGHQAGDVLLRGFAGRLVKTLRANDIVARPGGDEFAVIVEGLAQEVDASTIARHLVEAMRAPFILEERTVHITTSIGVAIYGGQPGVTARMLTKLADDLLYEAKGAGRDGFRVRASGATTVSPHSSVGEV